MKVTVVPVHMLVPALEEMMTEGVTAAETVIVIAAEVAVDVLAHAAFEVIIQTTCFPLARVLLV